MHLLHAGVNLVYIRDILGHADLKTTEIYARIDGEMKRKALEEAFTNTVPSGAVPLWQQDGELLNWLQSLGR
jgi:site-specific recombinase XerD